MTPYYEHAGITIYHGDCREILPSLKADVVVTDPPYGIGEKWTTARMVNKKGQSSRLWGQGETWDTRPVEGLVELLSAYPSIVWGGNYYPFPPMRGWLIWDKMQVFSGCEAELAWTNVVPAVRVFRLSRLGAFRNHSDDIKQHPSQKPIELMLWCPSFVPEGAVLDPYMGSGTTLVAAKQLGRKAIGIEIEERYCEIAAKRLAQEVLPLEPEAPIPTQQTFL